MSVNVNDPDKEKLSEVIGADKSERSVDVAEGSPPPTEVARAIPILDRRRKSSRKSLVTAKGRSKSAAEVIMGLVVASRVKSGSWEDEEKRAQRLETLLNQNAMVRCESLTEMEANVTHLEREVLWLTDECDRLQACGPTHILACVHILIRAYDNAHIHTRSHKGAAWDSTRKHAQIYTQMRTRASRHTGAVEHFAQITDTPG